MKNRRNIFITALAIALIAITTFIALPMSAHVAHASLYLGGKTISLKSANNWNLVSARIGTSGNPVQAIAPGNSFNTWEEFDVVDEGGGNFALKSHGNWNYVTANIGTANAPLQAIAGTAQGWEMFQIIDDGGGYISLKSSANGLYVSAWSPDPNTPLEARVGSIGAWEKFQLSTFVVTPYQFSLMFPRPNSFYSYDQLFAAIQQSYPGFANTGNDYLDKQDAAAFLANMAHETGQGINDVHDGLYYVDEVCKDSNGNCTGGAWYCDTSGGISCPSQWSSTSDTGYWGRGPLQLSWNFNYKHAGDNFGVDLLNHPELVDQNNMVAWKTSLWYWMTQNGPGSYNGHYAMDNSLGFGQTIRSINGAVECDGKTPDAVQDRINRYNSFVGTLGVGAGNNLYC